MASPKNKPGLPDNFGIDVHPSAIESPIQIGDYLDDDLEQAPSTLPADGTTVAEPPRSPQATELKPEKVIDINSRADNTPKVVPSAPPQESIEPVIKQPLRSPPKRKQVNMKVDTQRKADELLAYIQTYSVQADAKGSEMFDAILSLVYDAKEHIDLSGIPPRGKWGSPTARAFSTNLKNAFEQAIIINRQMKEQ